jgi:3-oxoacyl-[acyl-carrier-protein] synthase II
VRPEIVITGIGAVTPVGNSAAEFAAALREGRTGSGRVTRFEELTSGFPSRACEIKNFSPLKRTKMLDPFIQYILHATDEAISDSGLDFEAIDRNRLGLTVSSSKGGMNTFEKFRTRFENRRSGILGARVYANLIPNIAAQWIARHWKISGPAKPTSVACATGLYSVLEGVRMLEEDEADYCIAGAGDASITRLMTAGYHKMGVLATDEIRPFDKRRNGFLIGEGAGIVILEKADMAKSRGAKIYGKVLKHAYGFESSHPYAFRSSGNGLARCLKALFCDAPIAPKEVDYTNVHGTGTKRGDIYETAQIKKAFGKDAQKMALSSTKSHVGHMIGASGAVEIIACLIAMRDKFIPPTATLEKHDAQCDLDYTPKKAKEKEVKTTCSLSIGFGGQLGAILIGT